MGAWGIGIFEDDTACDTRDSIADATDLRAELEARLRGVLDSSIFDYEDAFDALVPAAIVDAYVNGTHSEVLDELRGRHPRAELQSLRTIAAEAVARVLDPKTELHELWAENEELYPEWRSNLESLKMRLSRK